MRIEIVKVYAMRKIYFQQAIKQLLKPDLYKNDV